jgi:hypothetical protein
MNLPELTRVVSSYTMKTMKLAEPTFTENTGEYRLFKKKSGETILQKQVQRTTYSLHPRSTIEWIDVPTVIDQLDS